MSPKCPKCGEEITILNEFVSGIQEYLFHTDGPGAGEKHQIKNFIPNEDVEEYRCPECDEVLFDHQPIEAARFLRGE